MAVNLAGLRTNGEHARRVKAVERFARTRIVRLGVANAPVHEIELRVVRARSPRRAAAVLPRVGILRPRFGTRLAWRRNRVPRPQLFPCLGIPTDEETARRRLAAGHSRDEDTVGHNRRARGVVAFFRIREFLVPHFLAGLHVERDDVVVDSDAEYFAAGDGRGAARDRLARDAWLQPHGGAPELTARFDVDGERPLPVDHVHDAVIDRWCRQLTLLVAQCRVPHRHQTFDRGFVDLFERAVTLPVEPHALCDDVVRVLPVVIELVGRLGLGDGASANDEIHQQTANHEITTSPNQQIHGVLVYGRRPSTPNLVGLAPSRGLRRGKGGHTPGAESNMTSTSSLRTKLLGGFACEGNEGDRYADWKRSEAPRSSAHEEDRRVVYRGSRTTPQKEEDGNEYRLRRSRGHERRIAPRGDGMQLGTLGTHARSRRRRDEIASRDREARRVFRYTELVDADGHRRLRADSRPARGGSTT